MSVENHPNIHAVGLTMDIIQAFDARLRGKAAKNKMLALSVLQPELVDFVTKISEKLDIVFRDEI